MKIVAALLVVEEIEKAKEMGKPKNQAEREVRIAVAFEDLRKCGVMAESIHIDQDVSGMRFTLDLFSVHPFPHSLLYEISTMQYASMQVGGHIGGPLDDGSLENLPYLSP